MKKAAALAHFGSVRELAKALDFSVQGVRQWGELVPAEAALALNLLTDGALDVAESDYPLVQYAERQVRAAAVLRLMAGEA